MQAGEKDSRHQIEGQRVVAFDGLQVLHCGRGPPLGDVMLGSLIKRAAVFGCFGQVPGQGGDGLVDVPSPRVDLTVQEEPFRIVGKTCKQFVHADPGPVEVVYVAVQQAGDPRSQDSRKAGALLFLGQFDRLVAPRQRLFCTVTAVQVELTEALGDLDRLG